MPENGKRQADRVDQTCSPVRETSSTDPRPFIKVKIGHKWETALVDPGSVRSYLDQKHTQRCRREGWEVADSVETAIMVDGAIVDIGEKITGKITAANHRIQSEFMELPSLSPGVLLGMDILSRHNLQIFLNGIKIAQKGNQDPGHACAIEGPVTM